ncbi:hypothetical protein CAF53_01860 [Sphingobium sp. LB126]|uniref:hypothetical protein n=1 Tax=Sphingobium sp. LB126 TaxID=1983755 RepID=UPI000C200EE1|nr:hypothetical protein [Sphingobium sp. LB126]PJG47121.1 hypothetical protein CAF53_01860 [Sphingobium sp. LB126]
MFDLIQLVERSGATIHADFQRWFEAIPAAAVWNILSDYSVGDGAKQNDAFSFVVLLNHDTYANIASYVAAAAPSDIKSTRTPSEGLLDYLSCPVAFSVNFVVERDSVYLRNLVTQSMMHGLTGALRGLVREWGEAEPPNAAFYEALDGRLRRLEVELARRQPSLNLLRQIFLVAAFASVVLGIVNDAKSPLGVRWISDRDAMFDRHGGIAFDLAWIFFQAMRRHKGGVIDQRRPEIAFGTPGMDGINEYAEFIRLPDLLAGTLADMKLPQMMFTHRKFVPVFHRLFVDTPNNAVIELVARPDGVTSRRLAFGHPPAGASTVRRSSEPAATPGADADP